MDLSKETAIVEAILFLECDPVQIQQIVKYSSLEKSLVVDVLASIKEKYKAEDFGIELIEISNGYMFSPKEELWSFLKNRYGKKNEEKMSRAAIETLSIIAYSQPVTKAEIDSIRGVSSGNMIRYLSGRGMVKQLGKKDVPGKPQLYGTTKEFLKHFRLKSIADLPKLDELDQERFDLDG